MFVTKPVIKMKAGWVRVAKNGSTTGPYSSKALAQKGGKPDLPGKEEIRARLKKAEQPKASKPEGKFKNKKK